MLSPAIATEKRITIDRADLSPLVDEFVAAIYNPDKGNDEPREQVEAAIWTWLGRAVDELVEEAITYTHEGHPRGFRSWHFREALRTWKPEAKQEEVA